jgi:hypothetical protein
MGSGGAGAMEQHFEDEEEHLPPPSVGLDNFKIIKVIKGQFLH